MNIAELKYVTTVAVTGSISAAAKALYVAQPNISKAIKSLEREYGVQLFTRSSRGAVPTREGQQFIRQANEILQGIDRLNEDFLTPNAQRSGLRVAIPRASYASQAFVHYAQKVRNMSEIRLHIRECNSLEALDYMIQQQYQLALIRFETQHEEYYRSMIRLKDLECETVLNFQYVLLTHENGPLAAADIRGYEDLDDYIELIHGDLRLPNGSFSEAMTKPEHLNTRKRIHVYERGSQFDLLQGIPETYMWVSPMPEELLSRYHLVQRPCSWQTKWMKDLLVYPVHGLLRKEEHDFVTELKNEIKKVSL